MNRLVLNFEDWLRPRGYPSLEDAVKFQKVAVDDDRYKLVDLALEWVALVGGTYFGMRSRYSAVRSHFLHARAELPKVPVSFTPTRDATVGHLDLESFKILLSDAGLREKAVYLTLFQGLMDQKRFFDSFNPKGYELSRHILDFGVNKPLRVNFLRGRKKNPHPFNSFIGFDALDAWRLYFERERGYPKEGEAAVLDQRGKPLRQQAFFLQHLRLIKKLNFAKGKSDRATRYGYNLHELRDLSRSILERAKADNFNTNSSEFWMGHVVDPLYYNKIWKLDPEYNLSQYHIAEKYLNILSGSTIAPVVADEVMLEKLKTSPIFHDYLESVIKDILTVAGKPQAPLARETA